MVLLADRALIASAVIDEGSAGITEVAGRALSDACRAAGISADKIENTVITGMAHRYLKLPGKYVTEVTSLARGIDYIYPEARTVVDIGAQKSLAVKCSAGIPLKIRFSEKCASGSGRFIDMVASAMGIGTADLSKLALTSKQYVDVQSTCTVFAESEIITLIHSNENPAAIARGAYRALARRLYGLVRQAGLEEKICVVGGAAHDACLLEELKREIGLDLVVPDKSDLVVAVGAALSAGVE